LWIVADTKDVGETLAIEPANQLHRHVHISISGSRDDGRRQVLALNYSKRIAAPAKPDADVGLLGKPHFVGVNANPKYDVGSSSAPSAHTERRRVGP
jgi:hypothetical protein